MRTFSLPLYKFKNILEFDKPSGNRKRHKKRKRPPKTNYRKKRRKRRN